MLYNNQPIESMEYKIPEIYISSIGNFLLREFANKKYEDYKFSIPQYQRPYKWTNINLIQLIDDIHESIIYQKEKKIKNLKYRIGTVVLHADKGKLNIVDGQQRFLTINIILRALKQHLENGNELKKYTEVLSEGFSSIETKKNLRTNFETILNKFRELSDPRLLQNIYDFVITNCEFVIVILFDISEAFQFFDSQNSRGKDLEPYDLLKAYHLRAVKALYENDEEKLDSIETQTINKWEKLASSGELKKLFKSLFHIRSWGKLYYQYFFTKDNISIFKGYTNKNNVILPPVFYFPLFAEREIINNNNSNVSEKNIDIPFQIDMPILNGEYFFYEIYHYNKLYDDFLKYVELNKAENEITKKIFTFLNTYKYRDRKGDLYLRHLFDCVSVYYLSKFGYEQFDNIVIKFFQWTYMLRLSQYSIRRETIINHSIKGSEGFNNVFRKVKEVDTVKDIMLMSPFSINSFSFTIKCSKETNLELIELFLKTLKLIKEPKDE